MLISLLEVVYIIITVIITGYVFSGMFKYKSNKDDLFKKYEFFNWKDIEIGMLIAAPGIILHELAHKFVALAFGLSATYQIYPTGLIIGILLRVFNTGFMFLAPGYVNISGATGLQSSLTAFAGPFMNFILWIGSMLILKYNKKLSEKTTFILTATQQVNMWLFIFNMLPIPPLDGAKVFAPLFGKLF